MSTEEDELMESKFEWNSMSSAVCRLRASLSFKGSFRCCCIDDC